MGRNTVTMRFCHTAVLVAAGVLVGSTTALAQGGGNVLPPSAKPHGTSLAEMAEITAFFNTGPRVPGTQPATPFQILFQPIGAPTPVFTVRPGTMFYVPVLYSDDVSPILGDMPDVTDQEAVANYIFNPGELGAVYIEIEVDGQVTSLGPGYAVGAITPLADGGQRYVTVAAFLSPLPKGTHTVTYRALFAGAALAQYPDLFPGGVWQTDGTYQVVVK